MIRTALIASCLLWSTACASSGSDAISAQPERAPASNTGLEAQTLASGECGLFLWTVSEPRSFVFFSKAGAASALVFLDGETASMSQASAEGAIFGQFMTEITYVASNENVTLIVYIEPGTLLEQGQRTKTARLTFTNSEGWETIVPVGGVRACQNH